MVLLLFSYQYRLTNDLKEALKISENSIPVSELVLLVKNIEVNKLSLFPLLLANFFINLSRVEVCTLLLSHGADPTILNCHSKNAIDVAATQELKDKLLCKLPLG